VLPICKVSLPTPWATVGPIHVYLIKQDPVTLIDTGVDTPEAREALISGLDEMGLGINDIRRVLLTHAHVDHMGLAAWIRDASGADVWLHPDEAGKAENPDWWLAERDRILAQAGVPEDVQHSMEMYYRRTRALALPFDGAWRPMAGGQVFPFEAGALRAVHLPGHALGHTGFIDEAGGSMVGGDHLLSGITPNPILEPLPPGHPAGAPHAPGRALTLGQFLQSLDVAAGLPLERVLPAHGPVILDHVRVVEGYKIRHERRLGKLWERLRRPATVYEVTREVYPNVSELHIFLAVSEVLAHLDLLAARGRAAVDTAGSVWVYRAQE